MKGVEIAFQTNKDGENDIVTALGNLTGNYFKNEENMDITWRIFHVTLDKEKYYRVLYKGEKISELHPENRKKIKEKFDQLSRTDYNALMAQYEKESRKQGFEKIGIKELTEEYDLWQDPLWNYI
ncbi:MULTISPECIES: DUF2004 domain-containing protein [Ferroplasma]|jgi:hypothetical protein|uniref:DUF2004 domain-containing protein n=2 Tax=Ferroplasma TaxID=74968 RepID=S0AP23_FERAC|nr:MULTISPECIES: DUF2004 domain-containing protein [Ferroplasma]MCL4348916.1 DUF2004 domain-containing protein [Candidatus Thermoplasmatota archaeon]AGO60522.1 hypothetical protein FACI_IFERC00001G0542 [Ferroplasma acidarmanus Fer1]ARD85322.1 hypothetical protein FAD_1464 [Ferroplasma acidiphilum]NOL60093.1 DUF2004 domain-containing protein [Ferroplasma acidiphilum]WMT52429.1 MAG: DUF2004 domain-containing protein [Ferroplasma acidiphilum]